MYHGIGACGGVGIGRAVVIGSKSLDYSSVPFSGAENEKARFDRAAKQFIDDTQKLAEAVGKNAGDKQGEILLGQITMLGDPQVKEQVYAGIDGGATAEAASDSTLSMFAQMFESMDDEMMRQRASDIRDLKSRLISILMGAKDLSLNTLEAGSVIVANDLTPSMTAGIVPQNVNGIVTQVGGVTSHCAIIARSMQIPAVLSVENALKHIKDGDVLIVDGDSGNVILNPDDGQLKQYQSRLEKLNKEKEALLEFKHKPTLTADSKKVELLCNIGSDKDCDIALDSGAEGVGLFRTEFLFMDRSSIPSEEEQFDAYKKVISAFGGREVILRTLDIGGDKDLPYLQLPKEENPFLGWRAIRYCLEKTDVFTTQLRAILRASAYGGAKILLPMVSCLDELLKAREILKAQMQSLDKEGIKYNPDIQVGVMIETPAAALISDILAKHADFFSIGTNDLTQYVMAVDRGNSKVSYLYSPLQPSVLRAINLTIQNAHSAGKPCGMCGEAAADKRLIPLLIGFGLDEFSVSPAAVAKTRREIARYTAKDAAELAKKALKLESEELIVKLLDEYTN